MKFKDTYAHMRASVEGEDLVNSDDQFLFYSWEPDFSFLGVIGKQTRVIGKQTLKQTLKFPKSVSTFVTTGVIFSIPKICFAKEFPNNSPSDNIVLSEGKSKSTLFDLGLAVLSQKTNLFFKNRQSRALVPYTPAPNIISPATNQSMVPMVPKSSAMVVSKRPQNRALVKRREILRRGVSSATYYDCERALVRPKRNMNRLSLTLQQMKEAVERECGIDFPSLFGGLDSAEANALLAAKDARIQYYRFLTKVTFVVSSIALGFTLYAYRTHVAKAQKAFDKLLVKYLRTRAKNLESAKLHSDLFPKWEEMISKYQKSLKEKNLQIKQIEATSANEIASLRLVIDMLTDDRDGLLKQLKFIKEHGDSPGKS